MHIRPDFCLSVCEPVCVHTYAHVYIEACTVNEKLLIA